ncbi:type II pantothenate kinase [Paenibacillus lycopersici]|uniref:Type II pantothenate kinase n=1 Tax=Paenibacillus lycopersici TaxID=2704462 RepID=A0A6C0G785_9BACL|nr:type II pantothenate kinase [Paenibacillus lycopersici]
MKIAYRTNGNLHYRSFPSKDIAEVAAWLEASFPEAAFCATGGKAEALQAQCNKPIQRMLEFDATCSGAGILMARQGIDAGPSLILTNIGTGTSVHHIANEQYRRVGGIGVGGGTLMGLARLMTGMIAYDEIIRESLQGNRDSIDLKVSDIYEGTTPPIPGDLTASNFAKAAHADADRSAADILAAIIGLVGETVTTISVQAAAQGGTSSIVYIGSTLIKNDALIRTIVNYTKLRGAVPFVLDRGEYCGAIGALSAIETANGSRA